MEGLQLTQRAVKTIAPLYLNTPTVDIPLEDLCYHPCELAHFIINISPQDSRPKLFKFLAVATFCHPVLVSYTQVAIESILAARSPFSFLKPMENKAVLLEALNIFAIIPGFSLSLLNISKWIQTDNEYQNALWANVLPAVCENNHQNTIQSHLQSIPEEATVQVKEFLNEIFCLKQQVSKRLDSSHYFENSILYAPRNLIHQLDISIARCKGLTTAEYLPDDYAAEYIEIWVDRTVELNSLLGNFVCRQRFGEFEYVKGPLTYAMEKGIMLVLNNFEQISNELLVGMRTLAQEMRIFHNQKSVKAKGGFKILGLCSLERMPTKMRALVLQNRYITHLQQQPRSALQLLPQISKESNRQYLMAVLSEHEGKYGLLSARKLWYRIKRARQIMMQSQDPKVIWDGFFTQSFKDAVDLEICELSNQLDAMRTIHFEDQYKRVKIGRTTLDVVGHTNHYIVKTQYSLSILERLSICSELQETPLLISQTGCGKTTLVQYLAGISGHQLYVYNMSSGTDVMDLVGGFKPIDCRSLLKELFFSFMEKFRTIPGSEKNEQYLQGLMGLYQSEQLQRLLKSLSMSIEKIRGKVEEKKQLREWEQLKTRFDSILANLDRIDSNLIFSFLEGNLIKAIKNGDWVLIDEINMATNDVLQKIVPLIEGKSLLLYEKGDLDYIERHPDFRIIACMNPANDSGKKPLPPNLMQKFTPINLAEPSRMDVELMVREITPALDPTQIADIFFAVKKEKTMSLRNLSRCLSYLNRNKDIYPFKRALYDSLLLGFQHKKILKPFEDKSEPKSLPNHALIQGFLVEKGPYQHEGESEVFHLTDVFLEHLRDFLRAIAGTELPVLLEGPTSAGKTSIIRYVASIAGHKCIRINNHEHTEVEQYLGNYFPDKQGKLVFREGPLVQAVKQGHWLILDELNLARTEILECLNRLLDDNRELFIPEQQKHIHPHKNFRIFATQNPSSYSGRKILSRAFRNRFISLSFYDITVEDTMAIMRVRRPILADSKELGVYVQKVLQTLQNYRQRQRVFSKDSVITIRDLLKWTGRKFHDKDSFVREGFALLGERLRTQEEKAYVLKVLMTGMKGKELEMQQEYERVVEEHLNEEVLKGQSIYVQMNRSFKRMAALTLKAVINSEPVLLVGETGCGKTTLAELLAAISGRKFYSINCHKHTEASDLLGSLRPCTKANSSQKFEYVNGVVIDAMLDGAVLLIDEINTAEDSVLERLNQVLQSNNIGVERGDGWQTITAKQGFCIIATMNPSGDYGKKQLSPALRNRFTEIWIEPITHPEYIKQAKSDITDMIRHKLSTSPDPTICENSPTIADLVFDFLAYYNCHLAPKYGLSRKLLTMRDIGWVCKFMNQCAQGGDSGLLLANWVDKYYYGVRILAVEGVNYLMGDLTQSARLEGLRKEILCYICSQLGWDINKLEDRGEDNLTVISLVKHLTFPLLIKTDLPLQLLGITPDERIFFSPHTELTDLLGQFRPEGTDFVWHDETLLSSVKQGKTLALMDLNLAQQPVVEGINSLFDHRGSIFVVEMNETYYKHKQFKPVVVLKETGSNDRKGLPNSFLNRFIKVRVKNVSTATKVNYLRNKYPQANNPNLWSYISTELSKDNKMKIEWLEYLCQLSVAGQGYFHRGIEILNLPQPNHPITLLPKEEEVVQLLPLRKEYGVSDVRSLTDCCITLSQSSFSVCLVGDATARDNMAAAVGYLTKKTIVKVILSTMTDMAQLLGSYEQVQQGSNDQQTQDWQQINIESVVQRSYQQTVKSMNTEAAAATSFKYVQSRIMKTLMKADTHLLYVEVPNQSMMERVEKGVNQIFEQKVKVLVGVDRLEGSNDTKLIPFRLAATAGDDRPQVSVASGDVYTPNYSLLKQWDQKLRLDEAETWINDQVQDLPVRSQVKAYQRLLQFLSNLVRNSNNFDESEEQSTHYQRVQRNQWSKMGLQQDFSSLQLPINEVYHEYINSLLQVARSKQELEMKDTIIELFTKNNHRTLIEGIEQEGQDNKYRSQLTLPFKFQCLYLGDSDLTFKNQANRLLQLLYQRPGQGSKQILQKFKKEIEEMYSVSSAVYNQEILIQFNEDQYKVIPILDSLSKSRLSYYALANLPASINLLAGFSTAPSPLLHALENQLYCYMLYMGLNSEESSKWLWGLSIRDLPIFSILRTNLLKNGFDFYTNYGDCMSKLLIKDRVLSESLQLSGTQTAIEVAHRLYQTFKPSDSMGSNLAVHIRTQLQMRTLQSLAMEDLQFRDAYQKLCGSKYEGYEPNSFKIIDERVQKYRKELERVKAKLYVYRGYDNIRVLRHFYLELMLVCSKIEENNFSIEVLEQEGSKLYKFQYSAFKDILWPILAALSMMHSIRLKERRHNRIITLDLLQTSQKPFHKAIELIMQKEEQQFHDAAKDYTKYQRKFNKTVIVDEYTQQGVKKNKENDEQEFKQFFGKTTINQSNEESILDELYMLVRRRTGKYELKMFKEMFTICNSLDELVVGFEIKYPQQPSRTYINIYEEWDMGLSEELTAPIPKILAKTKALLQKYNIDSIRILGTLSNKIQEHKVHDQVYKILSDCQFLVDKIIEVNAVLPSAERVDDSDLVAQCLRMRRIQLKNWKSMLAFKVSRIQKSDTIEFIHFFRNFMQIGKAGQSQSIQIKECFRICDDFMRQSRMSCYDFRLSLLALLANYLPNPAFKKSISRVCGFYQYLREGIEQQWQTIKKQKLQEMAEYEKLSSWSSNQYLIFKATCQKFQRKIHHILKRYEQQLAMQIGVFHTTYRNKHITNSVPEFITCHRLPLDIANKYDEVVAKIFEALEDIKQEQHNTQYKMLIIRKDLADLEEIVEELAPVSSKNLESQVLAEQMFSSGEMFQKAMKYYYGMWDKLCQKTQTAWNRDIVERIWGAVEKIWSNVNSMIPEQDFSISSELDDQTDNLLILYEKFISQEGMTYHPIFAEELEKVKGLLKSRQEEYEDRLSHKYRKIDNENELVSLMKVGYLVSSIALNLEKNGLCVKEQQQENGEQSGTQEVGDGMGIGQGEAHEGAENVGDEIEFEQQVQGHKGQEQNQDKNADKKEENDIEMEGDFNGDMYSKEEQGQDQQGKSEQADEQMGSVDNQEREEDMKNQQGEAQGKGEADVDIEGQEDGESELVDNEQPDKQTRKNQDKGPEDQQDGQDEEQEKSDWGDNNEQGDKINKQEKVQGEQEEENQQSGSMDEQDQESGGMDEEGQAEQISGQGEEKDEDEDQDDDKMDEQEEEGSQQGNQEGDALQIDEEEQQPEDQPEQSQQQEKKVKRTRKTKMQAYGRTDLNSDNPLKDNDKMEGEQKNEGGAEAEGGTDGDKGSGDPVHSLSADLLREILNLEKANAQQNIIKDLNVVAHDQQNEAASIEEGGEERQQFELTEEDHKIGTNLPAFVEGEQEQIQQNKQKQKKEQSPEQKRKEKQMQEKQDKADDEKNEKKAKNSKADVKKEDLEQQNAQNPASSKKEEQISRNDAAQKLKEAKKQQSKHQPPADEYLKQIVKAQAEAEAKMEIEIKDDGDDKSHILQEAYQVSKQLEQQLKSVLEPMDNAEYRGDYKTGKKLNLKKIIPFIASNYRKDRIWLRRTEPSERNYNIMIALDDTKSMHHGGVGTQALKGTIAIASALHNLSIKTCITGIRQSMVIHKQFQGLLEPLKIVNSFDFSHQSQRSHDLSIASFMQASLQEFKKSQSAETGVENKQLCFIISDGKMNKDYVRPFLKQARKRDIIYVFIIIDSEKGSILNTKSTSIGEDGKVKMQMYMSDFPFEYFLIVKRVEELGDILATTLMQFIQQK